MTTSIRRLYKDMTPRQLAVVAVNAELAGDYDTPKEILAHIPRKTYAMSDAAYTDTAQFLEGMVIALMADYWQACAMHTGLTLALTTKIRRPDSLDADDDVIEQNREELLRIMRMADDWRETMEMFDHLCTVICEETGLDEKTVRKRSRLPDEGPTDFDLESLSPQNRSLFEETTKTWRENLTHLAA